MKKQSRAKTILIKGVTLSLSFSLGGFSGNLLTKNYYIQEVKKLQEEQRIAVPFNGIEGAYITAPISKVDSIRAKLEDKKEDGSNIDRKRGGRRN